MRCWCSDQTWFTVRTLIQHHADYHSGLLTVAMLLDQTRRWRNERVRRENPPPYYSNIVRSNRDAFFAGKSGGFSKEVLERVASFGLK